MKQYIVQNIEIRDNYVVLKLHPSKKHDGIKSLPGQYVTLSLKRDGRWTPTRCLSITNFSHIDGSLEFAFKVTGQFTGALAAVQVGDPLRVQGAFGEFVVPSTARHVVMIAGGIGITPFMNIMRSASTFGTDQQFTLLYSNQDSQDIPFEKEIRELAASNQNITAYFFVSNDSTSSTNYIKGRITSKHLEQLVGDQVQYFTYMICGPDRMMQSMSKSLIEMGAYHEDILTEDFAASNSARARYYLFGLKPVQAVYALGAMAFVVLAGGIGYKDVQAKLAASQSQIQTTTIVAPTQSNPTPAPDTSAQATDTPAPTPDATSGSSSSYTAPTPAATPDPSTTYSNSNNNYYQAPRSSQS